MSYSFIKKVIMVFFFMTITNVVYGNNPNITLYDVMCNSIPLEEQLEFLEQLKEHPSFSQEDFSLIQGIIMSYTVDKVVKFKILEILLQDDINDIPTSICDDIKKYMLHPRTPVDDWFLPLKVIIKVDPQNGSHQRKIFFPFSSSTANKDLLDDYEKYLVKNLKYFAKSSSTGFEFYETIKDLFFKTKNADLKSEYIDAMFYLDMWRTLLKIISKTSLDYEYRIQAILVSLRLLPHSNSFEEFSEGFLNALKKIADDTNETVKLRDISYYMVHSVKTEKISLKNFGNENYLCTHFFTDDNM